MSETSKRDAATDGSDGTELVAALREPRGYRDLVRLLADELQLRDEDIARAAGVSPGTVRQWRARTGGSDVRRWEPIDDLRVIVVHLLGSGAVGRDLVKVWLRGRNTHLGYRRPLDELAEGRFDRVLAAADRLIQGPASVSDESRGPGRNGALPRGAEPRPQPGRQRVPAADARDS